MAHPAEDTDDYFGIGDFPDPSTKGGAFKLPENNRDDKFQKVSPSKPVAKTTRTNRPPKSGFGHVRFDRDNKVDFHGQHQNETRDKTLKIKYAEFPPEEENDDDVEDESLDFDEPVPNQFDRFAKSPASDRYAPKVQNRREMNRFNPREYDKNFGSSDRRENQSAKPGNFGDRKQNRYRPDFEQNDDDDDSDLIDPENMSAHDYVSSKENDELKRLNGPFSN